MEVCDNPENCCNLTEYFNVGGGVVMVGCNKCPYWQPVDRSNQAPLEITFTSADGSTETFIY
jgi:hypothetical protein